MAKKTNKKKPETTVRSYPQKSLANKGKISSLWELFLLYRQDAEIINSFQKRLFFETFKANKNAPKSNSLLPQDYLGTSRYRQTQQYQVVGQINSYLGVLRKQFTKIVFKSISEESLRHKLCYINKAGLWLVPPEKLSRKVVQKLSSNRSGESELSIEDITKTAKVIFKRLLKQHKWPSCLEWLTMNLDGKVAVISHKGGNIGQSKKQGKASVADYWVQVSTYQSGKFIQVPLKTNKYFTKAPGRRNNNVSISFNKDSSLKKISFTRGSLKKPKKVLPEIAKYLNIDVGLNCQLATHHGDLLGQGYKKQLDYYDKIENSLRKELKQRELPYWENKRWKNINRIRTEYIKNETGRNTNKLISLHHPDILVSEALNWQGCHLSSQMNRHLHRYGQGVMEKKIDNFLEQRIIHQHIKKNPAYSSKMCNRCIYVDANNRKKDKFQCLVCGHKAHADCNAAKNQELGSSKLYDSKEKVLQELVAASVTRLRKMPLSQEAIASILANPYYSSYHKDFHSRVKSTTKAEDSNKGKSLTLEKGGQPHLSRLEHLPEDRSENRSSGDAIIVGYDSGPQLTPAKHFS